MLYVRRLLLGDPLDMISLAIGIAAFAYFRALHRRDGKLLSDFALLSMLLALLNPIGVRFAMNQIPMLPRQHHVVYLFSIVRSFIAGLLAVLAGLAGIIAVRCDRQRVYGTPLALVGIAVGLLYVIAWVGLYVVWANSMRGWDH